MSHLPIIRKRPMPFLDSAEETFCSHCDDLWPCEVHELQKENERLRATLPETFYADRPLVERVEQIVRIWKNAIEANKALETRLDAALPHIEAVLADAGTHTISADPTRRFSGHGFAWDELQKAIKALRGEK